MGRQLGSKNKVRSEKKEEQMLDPKFITEVENPEVDWGDKLQKQREKQNRITIQAKILQKQGYYNASNIYSYIQYYMYTLPSQRYGILFQNMFRTVVDKDSFNIPASDKMGDFCMGDSYNEFKFSKYHSNEIKNHPRLIQFRHDHDYDYDILLLYDVSTYKFSLYRIPHKAFTQAVKQFGKNTDSHGPNGQDWCFSLTEDLLGWMDTYKSSSIRAFNKKIAS
jgi:hypothetical protein